MLTVALLKISPDETLVRVGRADGGPAWIFRPFETSPAAFAAEVIRERVLVANEAGELALFDPKARACLRRGNLGCAYKKLMGLVRRGGGQAVLYTK